MSQELYGVLYVLATNSLFFFSKLSAWGKKLCGCREVLSVDSKHLQLLAEKHTMMRFFRHKQIDDHMKLFWSSDVEKKAVSHKLKETYSCPVTLETNVSIRRDLCGLINILQIFAMPHFQWNRLIQLNRDSLLNSYACVCVLHMTWHCFDIAERLPASKIYTACTLVNTHTETRTFL